MTIFSPLPDKTIHVPPGSRWLWTRMQVNVFWRSVEETIAKDVGGESMETT